MKEQSVLVCFKNVPPSHCIGSRGVYDCVVAPIVFESVFKDCTKKFIPLESLLEPGSVYGASALAQDLSRLQLPNGTPITTSCTYKGYELWWMHYSDIFLYSCLPYTQYKRLLALLKDFHTVYLHEPPYRHLFSLYLEAHSRTLHILRTPETRGSNRIPFGIVVQVALTALSLPVALVLRRSVLVFTGDKFDGLHDYDARMRFVYEELRKRNVPFIEFVRSLEPWNTVILHALRRRRPVVYSVALAFLGQLLGVASGARRQYRRMYDSRQFNSVHDAEERFMLRLATFYLRDAGDDIWGIRINRFILRALGVRAGLVPAATERNFQTVIGAKLNHIPTVGILHGFASRHYNMYDFMHTYSGEKTFSVDRYGLWSEWWKEYYQRYSKAYRGEQLYVSGPMRPSVPQSKNGGEETREAGRPLRVLLVSEIVAVPSEVLPYLEALTTSRDIAVSIKFRATGDRFEEWLTVHRPDILRMLPPGNILKGRMDEAIQEADVVVGSQSTGVIEATLQDKPFVLFNTEKWGDYFDMRSFGGEYKFFAENPGEFIGIVRDTKDVPVPVLRSIRQKFFGDAEKNGSAWAVDQLEEYLRN